MGIVAGFGIQDLGMVHTWHIGPFSHAHCHSACFSFSAWGAHHGTCHDKNRIYEHLLVQGMGVVADFGIQGLAMAQTWHIGPFSMLPW